MRRTTWVRTSAPIVAALALLGFGGGGGGADDFRDEADEICTDGAEQALEVLLERGTPQSLEDDVALTEETLAIREEVLSRLEELEPPEKLQSDFEEFLGLREERIANDQAFLEAASSGDEEAIAGSASDLVRIREDQREVGEALGFQACAELMSKKQEKKVRQLVEKTLTTGDPDFCTELYTENFVEAIGGLEACEEGESNPPPGDVLDGVEIEEVFGINKLYASVFIIPEGGANDGQPAVVELLYQDGVYKRDAIYAAPPEE